MVYLQFIVSAALIVYAATRLAKYGDVIAIRTGLGRMFVGLLLLAGATSLPEVLTTVSAVFQEAPDLAAGNLLGSNMVNMFLLALIDLIHRKERLLRKVALKHALSGSLAVFIIGLVVFFIMADLPFTLGWVGVDSLLIMGAYLVAMRLIQSSSTHSHEAVSLEIPAEVPSLRRSLLGFGLASAVLLVVTPIMVRSSHQIAESSGLGDTFIGTSLVAFVTSLPELMTTLAALRLGADDMAIGNLYGSNLFNMFALGLTDLFYLPGRFLGVISPDFLLVGMLGLLMTGMGLIGNLARLDRRVLFIEFDSLALFITYGAGMYLLYLHGVVR